MSALAVYLEREGIATLVFALVRLHAEITKPPRALWVPFELGRPLGGPGHAGFRNQVLDAGLALLEREDGPVILEDYPHDDPGGIADEQWRAPDLSAAESIEDEIAILTDAYASAGARFGTTQVGLSGLSFTDTVQFFRLFDTPEAMSNPDDGMSELRRVRHCVDDIRSYYQEAACASGNPTTDQLGRWFWKTRAGLAILDLRKRNLENANATRQVVLGRLLVPGRFVPA